MKAKFSIVPSLHAIHFLEQRGVGNQSGLQSTVEENVKVKMIQVEKSRYQSSVMQLSVTDYRDRDILELDYPKQFRKL